MSTSGSLGIWYDINMEMISYGDGTFGSFPNSCHLEIRLYSNADFFKWKDGLDEWGTRIFPKRIGPYILSTHVITKKPMDPDLERDIFKKVEEVATAFLKQR